MNGIYNIMHTKNNFEYGFVEAKQLLILKWQN